MVVGFGGGGPERSGDPDLDSELYGLHLLEDSQQRGVGRRLVMSVASNLARNGMVSMLVWVLEQNRPACLFYKALGGLPVREQEISIGGGGLGRNRIWLAGHRPSLRAARLGVPVDRLEGVIRGRPLGQCLA